MQQAQQTNIKVLVGDSSVRSRLVLSGMIDAEPGLEVVDTARTKEELMDKALTSRPDMIVANSSFTVNAHLPFFQVVYQAGGCTLLMAPSHNSLFQLFQFSKKRITRTYTSSFKSIIWEGTKEELIGKMKEYAHGKVSTSHSLLQPIKQIKSAERVLKVPKHHDSLSVVVIGASTGGSKAIQAIFDKLEMPDSAVILIALHMPERFSKRFANRLQMYTDWEVEEGYRGLVLKPRTIVIAPGGQNMIVKRNPLLNNSLFVDFATTPITLDTPSVDLLLESAAVCAKQQVLGVILSGMGTDGTAGAQEVYRHGGKIIAQDEASSTVFGMAHSVIKSGVVSGVYALDQIHHSIRRFAVERSMGLMLESDLVG